MLLGMKVELMKTNFNIKTNVRNEPNSSSFQIENIASELQETITIIKIRELNKRYTHANPKSGRCTQDCCPNVSTHWLTRENSDYCQSDMICNQHAKLWMEIRDLLT